LDAIDAFMLLLLLLFVAVVDFMFFLLFPPAASVFGRGSVSVCEARRLGACGAARGRGPAAVQPVGDSVAIVAIGWPLLLLWPTVAYCCYVDARPLCE
jgi:hypothetical protein